jgi:hypothetical protein
MQKRPPLNRYEAPCDGSPLFCMSGGVSWTLFELWLFQTSGRKRFRTRQFRWFDTSSGIRICGAMDLTLSSGHFSNSEDCSAGEFVTQAIHATPKFPEARRPSVWRRRSRAAGSPRPNGGNSKVTILRQSRRLSVAGPSKGPDRNQTPTRTRASVRIGQDHPPTAPLPSRLRVRVTPQTEPRP